MKKGCLFVVGIVLVFMVILSSFVVSAADDNDGICEDGEGCTDTDCSPDYAHVCDGVLICGEGTCNAWEWEPEYFVSGLPECFVPEAAYVHETSGEGEIVSLWGENGDAYVWPAGRGSFRRYFGNERLAQGIPSDFVIKVGYSHELNGAGKEVIGIWDGTDVYVYNNDPGEGEPFFRPLSDSEKLDAGLDDLTSYGGTGFVPFEGYYHEANKEIYLWVEEGSEGFSVLRSSSGGIFNPITINMFNQYGENLGVDKRPEVVYYETTGSKTIAWLDMPTGPQVWKSTNGVDFIEVTGTYMTGLPSGFLPTVGYAHGQGAEEIVGLWDANGNTYVRVGGSAFVEFTDEEKERYGLPVEFIPQEGYTHNLNPLGETIVLIDASGEIYVSAYEGGGFRKFLDSEKAEFGLPSANNFKPILGYTHNFNPGGELISLWDGNGIAYVWDLSLNKFVYYNSLDIDGDNIPDIVEDGLNNFEPIVGYSHNLKGENNEVIGLWDVVGKIMVITEGDESFSPFTEEDKEDIGLGGFKAILGYTSNLNDNELISLWDADGNVRIMSEGDTGFRAYKGAERNDQGLEDFNAIEGYYYEHWDKVFLWNDAGILAVWSSLLGKFKMTQENANCIPPSPVGKGISCENRNSAELCNEYGVGETLPKELLRSIEGFNEAFADANEIDYDFCSNPVEGSGISCYCEWDTTNNLCNSVVARGIEDCRTVITSAEIEGVCAEDDEYFLTWDSQYTGPEVAEEVGCVGGSRTFQCPSKVGLPFFGLFNVVLSLMIVLVGYGIFWVDRKK